MKLIFPAAFFSHFFFDETAASAYICPIMKDINLIAMLTGTKTAVFTVVVGVVVLVKGAVGVRSPE